MISVGTPTAVRDHRNIDLTTYVVSAIFLLLGIILFKSNHPEYFVFRFNKYALLSGIEVAANVGLLAALVVRKGNFMARLWFAITVTGSILLGLGEMFERFSTTPSQALLWSHLGVLGLFLIPIGLYMFVHFFTESQNKHSDIIMPAILFGVGSILMLQTLTLEPLRLIKDTISPWGYAFPQSKAFVLLVLWLGVISSFSVIRFVGYRQNLKDARQRAQAKIMIIGVSYVIFSGIAGDVLPRYLGYNIFPVGVLLQMAAVVAIIYAIYRYNTFAINYTQVAGEILDTLAESIIVTDINLKIQSINSLGLKLSGYNRETILAQPVTKLFDKKNFAILDNLITKDLVTKKVLVVGEMELMTRLGGTVSVNLSIAKLEGDYPAYLFALSDISELKKYYGLETKRNEELQTANAAYQNQQLAMVNLLEDSRDLGEQLQREKANVELKVEQRTAELRAERARLEASINSLNIGFIIVDDQKNIITANGAFTKILGTKLSEKKPQLNMLSSALEDSFDVVAAIDNCFIDGKEISKDNLQFGSKVLRIFMAPIFEDDVTHGSLGAVILVEDISEAKAVERSRDEFFSIASHELRTPLTAIRGNTQMIREYYKELLTDPSLNEMIDDIHDSSIRLISIVNDFLDTSRLEQGKITFQLTDFDLVDLVEEIKQEFTAGQVNTALYIKILKPKTKLPFVRADRDRLKQAVFNLIGNSLKFTEKGGVTAKLRLVDGMAYISVSDTGKGIPIESQNLLFRKFQQASNNILTRDFTRSTGLGLYISKLVVEGMQGKIYLEKSVVNKGSTFTIEIPVAKTNTTKS